MASRECLWVRVCLLVYNHPHDCSFFPGQSLISPSVETRFWRKVKSAMWVTTTPTCAASVPRSLPVFSVASNLAKSAGITTVQWHVFESKQNLNFLLQFYSPSVERVSVSIYPSARVRACAAVGTVSLSQRVRPVTRRQTVRGRVCVQASPHSAPSQAPRKTSQSAAKGHGSA